MITALDDPASLDPATAGAKAAWLAAGRRAGLPILPGIVVAVGASEPSIALGAGLLEGRRTGAARLAIAQHPFSPALEAAVRTGVDGLGPRLVVRSSSPLEGDGTWAGAFTSYLDVTIDELPTAIRGCWASAFSNGTVERAALAGVDTADLGLAVLVQPAISPDVGGTARLVGDELRIVAVRGSPAPLLQGWEPGVRGSVRADGTIDGDGLIALVGRAALELIDRTLRTARAAIGATTCEWAVVDDVLSILQLGRDADPAAVGDEPAPILNGTAADLARLARMARTIRHAPGSLGEALILRWALGEGTPGGQAEVDLEMAPRIPVETLSPSDALREAVGLADVLTMRAWPAAPGTESRDGTEAAETALAALRGLDPVGAAAELVACPAPPPAAAQRMNQLLARVRGGLVAVGAARTDSDAWHHSPTDAAAALARRPEGSETPAIEPSSRPRFDAWVPFQTAVILATGDRRNGAASGPGLGVGRLAVVTDATRPTGVGSRDVIVAPRPLPHLAPLLWDAAAVVTVGGGPGAHLFESARAIGLPAVSGIGRDDLIDAVLADPEPWAIAVDGSTGTVAFTPW
jgi:hypothetical protein